MPGTYLSFGHEQVLRQSSCSHGGDISGRRSQTYREKIRAWTLDSMEGIKTGWWEIVTRGLATLGWMIKELSEKGCNWLRLDVIDVLKGAKFVRFKGRVMLAGWRTSTKLLMFWGAERRTIWLECEEWRLCKAWLGRALWGCDKEFGSYSNYDGKLWEDSMQRNDTIRFVLWLYCIISPDRR